MFSKTVNSDSIVITHKLEAKGARNKLQNFVDSLTTASQGWDVAESVTIEGCAWSSY